MNLTSQLTNNFFFPLQFQCPEWRDIPVILILLYLDIVKSSLKIVHKTDEEIWMLKSSLHGHFTSLG